MIVALARKLLVALWGIPLAPRGSLRPGKVRLQTRGHPGLAPRLGALCGDAIKSLSGRRCAPGAFFGHTSVSRGIDFARTQIERAPLDAKRRVMDVSGDGDDDNSYMRG